MISLHFYKMGRAAADSRSRSNPIATLMRQCRARGTFTSETSELFKPETANPRPFSGGVQRGDSLLRKRIPPLIRAALRALLSPSRPTGAT